MRQAKVDHLLRDGGFEVHARQQLRRERDDVGILDVAAVFAQVQGDAVGAGLLGHQRGADRVRVRGAARVAQRGDVVDVHAKVDDGAGGLQEAH
jgi:hypothetical protein